MTPEAQRIAIGEACGWNMLPVGKWLHKGNPQQTHPTGTHASVCHGVVASEIPDYLNDLNAMAEAEQFAIFEEGAGSIAASEEYGRQLIRIVLEVEEEGVPATLSGVAMVARATASQRAEAFLKTLNLWTE